MSKKITFKKGVKRINFPTLGTDAKIEIAKILSFYKLPKYSKMGFEWVYHRKTKDFPPFVHVEVFIEK